MKVFSMTWLMTNPSRTKREAPFLMGDLNNTLMRTRVAEHTPPQRSTMPVNLNFTTTNGIGGAKNGKGWKLAFPTNGPSLHLHEVKMNSNEPSLSLHIANKLENKQD